MLETIADDRDVSGSPDGCPGQCPVGRTIWLSRNCDFARFSIGAGIAVHGFVTAPNPRYENCDIMVTRRVHNREYRLRPGTVTNEIVEFVIATLVEHYELELNAFNTMSTHYHCRFHDPHGNASNFCRDAHSMIARLIIFAYGEDDESLWAPVSSNILEDDEPEGGIDQIGYIMAQGVAAGAVKDAKSWPGAKGRWPNKSRTINRPRGFFQEDCWRPGKLTEAGNPAIHWAETATLRFTRPRGYDHLTDSDLNIEIEKAIAARVALAHEKFKNVPDAFPGRRAALRTPRRHRATSREPKRGAKRVPLIRCASDPERRIERLRGLTQWRKDYRACRIEFRTNREVLFPNGTNKMKVDLDVNVDELPT